MPALDNARQERFCQALARGMPAIHAYTDAGYSPSTSAPSELCDNPRIAARVTELHLEAARSARITRASILVRLDKLADRCMQAEPVLDSEGCETGEYKFNAQGAHAALKTLGEMIPPDPADATAPTTEKPVAADDVAESLLRLRADKQSQRDGSGSDATH